MTKPLYFWNGSSFELVGPTTPQSPFAYQTSAPTAPATGDIWIDSDGDVDTYNRQLTRYYFVATAGQTSVSGTDANGLTLAYVAGSEAVYVNGALQVRGVDYTATNGTSITGLSALALNDVVEVFAYTAFTVANAYTKSESDGLFATTTNFPAGAWTSYTPTLKQSSTTVSATVNYAKYIKLGKTVFLTVKLTSTGTGSAGGRIGISAPSGLAPTLDSLESVHGNFGLLDAGTAFYHGFCYYQSSTVGFGGLAQGSGDAIGANSPSITLATNDVVMIHVVYEVA